MEDTAHVGSLPNIYHQAVSLDELRASPTFDALPPAAALALAGPSSWRYVRQDDPLWSRLHSGRLTSGYVAAALGLFEPAAAARLKIGKSRASHGRLLEAWRHLCQEPYSPGTNPHITEESAAVHNAAVMEVYNREGGAGEEAALPAAVGATATAAAEDASVSPPDPEESGNANAALETSNAPKKKKKKRKGRRKVATPALAPAPSGYGGSNGASGPLTEESKLRKARSVGSQGLMEVRCEWGRAQEGAALRVLGAAFPGSRLGEVGLCVPETIPEEWGFALGDLPSLGSSPDGVIRHPQGALLPLPGAPLNGAVAEESDDERADTPFIKHTKSVVEAVEVKNSCPFDLCRHGRGPSGGRRRYVVCDRGPRRQLDPLWIPQLQMHMLCTGTASAVLISRSASRGARLFRMAVDPELQRLMLCVLRQLWTDHVLPRQVPPLNAFAAMPEHAAMLRRMRTVAAAADAAAGEVTPEQAAATLRGLESRYFLD